METKNFEEPFKNEKVNKAFVLWRSNNPDSCHEYDKTRWFQMVLLILQYQEEFDLAKIEKHRPANSNYFLLTDDMIEQYMTEYWLLKGFYDVATKANA